MSEIVIRPHNPADKKTILSLLGELQVHEIPLQAHLLPWEQVREAYWIWLGSSIDENSGFISLAEIDQKPVGMIAGYVDQDNYPASVENDYGYIAELIVTGSARKKGVATALMKHAENQFLQRNIKIMKLTTFANNRLAGDFYAKYGMQQNLITYKKYLKVAA